MDIVLLIVGVIIGAAATWFFAHVYYKKSAKDQDKLYSKLSRGLREIILTDPRETLTAKELNSLIQEKTIDPDSNAPLPYKACPECGCKDLKGGHVVMNDRDYFVMKCEECGWTDLTE